MMISQAKHHKNWIQLVEIGTDTKSAFVIFCETGDEKRALSCEFKISIDDINESTTTRQEWTKRGDLHEVEYKTFSFVSVNQTVDNSMSEEDALYIAENNIKDMTHFIAYQMHTLLQSKQTDFGRFADYRQTKKGNRDAD